MVSNVVGHTVGEAHASLDCGDRLVASVFRPRLLADQRVDGVTLD